MATFFSDHYTATGTDDSTWDAHRKPGAGIGHGRLRYKRAFANATLTNAASDEIRMATFKSGDRISAMWLSMQAGGAGALLDVGIYNTGLQNDGAVIEIDLFVNALDVAAAQNRTDVLVDATGHVLGSQRGMALWEMVDLGASTVSTDPFTQYDIVLANGGADIADADYVLEVYYTSGD